MVGDTPAVEWNAESSEAASRKHRDARDRWRASFRRCALQTTGRAPGPRARCRAPRRGPLGAQESSGGRAIESRSAAKPRRLFGTKTRRLRPAIASTIAAAHADTDVARIPARSSSSTRSSVWPIGLKSSTSRAATASTARARSPSCTSTCGGQRRPGDDQQVNTTAFVFSCEFTDSPVPANPERAPGTCGRTD